MPQNTHSKYFSEDTLNGITLMTHTPDNFAFFCSNQIKCMSNLGSFSVRFYPEVDAIAYIEGSSKKSSYKHLEEDTLEKIVSLHGDLTELKTYLDNLKVHRSVE